MLTSLTFKLLIRNEHTRKGTDILRFRDKLNYKDNHELLPSHKQTLNSQANLLRQLMSTLA